MTNTENYINTISEYTEKAISSAGDRYTLLQLNEISRILYNMKNYTTLYAGRNIFKDKEEEKNNA